MPDFDTEAEVDKYWAPLKASACGAANKCYEDRGTRKGSADFFECQDKHKSYVKGLGAKTCSEIVALWNADKKNFGSAAKGGEPPYIPSKKPDPIEPVPAPPPKLVSFGKLFLSFCLPALSRIAEQEGIDEVQINFFQLNDSCGPVSLHSVAEFPIEIDRAEQKFADFCAQRGGESMSVFDFTEWCSTQLFGDMRAVGYGMRHIYEAEVDPKPEAAKKDDKKDKEAAEAKKSQNLEYFKKYGKFQPPFITMRLDTVYEGESGK